jgi:single-stranded DNA-binding protein
MILHGFIVSPPELNFTVEGAARFYACVGIEHFRRDPDGTFMRLDPTFHDIVMFGAIAERAYARFKMGDQFVASGYIHEYELDQSATTQSREEFVARRIGHDLACTRYEVDRNPSRQTDPPDQPVVVRAVPPRAVSV